MQEKINKSIVKFNHNVRSLLSETPNEHKFASKVMKSLKFDKLMNNITVY
jgi:hypothetical protein